MKITGMVGGIGRVQKREHVAGWATQGEQCHGGWNVHGVFGDLYEGRNTRLVL